METTIVSDRVSRTHPLQRVVLTFTNDADGIRGLRTLVSLHLAGAVTIHSRDLLVAQAVVESGDWERPENATISVTFSGLNAHRFGDLIGPHLIQMGLFTPHALTPIMTKRQKKQAEAVDTIIAACLTPALINEARGWGIEITGKLDTSEPGVPSIKFEIVADQTVIKTVVLDGWSGRIFVDGKGEDQMISSNDGLSHVTDVLRQHMNAYIETATS